MPKVCVFALQRSGTNFIEQCILKNFKDIEIVNLNSNYIWKHDYGFDENRFKEDHCHIYMVKHPYKWVESVFNNNVDMKIRWQKTVKKDGSKVVIDGFDLDELGKLWNDHTIWWFEQMKKRDIMFLKFENVIKSRESEIRTIRKIRNKFNFEWLNGNDAHIVIPETVPQSTPFTEQKRQENLNLILKTLTWEGVQALNRNIDNDLFEILMYKKINSEDEYMKHINKSE